MAQNKITDLNQKKNAQQPSKDISKSPGSGDHKASDQHAKIPPGQQVQPGQLGPDSDRQSKGGGGQQK